MAEFSFICAFILLSSATCLGKSLSGSRRYKSLGTTMPLWTSVGSITSIGLLIWAFFTFQWWVPVVAFTGNSVISVFVNHYAVKSGRGKAWVPLSQNPRDQARINFKQCEPGPF
ncbi:MAG: hypothetical protein V4607_00580 [Pseudomonadota bacterium]